MRKLRALLSSRRDSNFQQFQSSSAFPLSHNSAILFSTPQIRQGRARFRTLDFHILCPCHYFLPTPDKHNRKISQKFSISYSNSSIQKLHLPPQNFKPQNVPPSSLKKNLQYVVVFLNSEQNHDILSTALRNRCCRVSYRWPAGRLHRCRIFLVAFTPTSLILLVSCEQIIKHVRT